MRILLATLLAIASAASGTAVAAQAPPATFPAQQRKPGDVTLIARGNSLYGLYCRACHGADLRGGDMGGPNLLRSQLVLNDQAGEAIGPVVRTGRTPPAGGTAMPPLPLPDEDVKAVAEYIHSVVFTAQPQGAPPAAAVELNLLVGNAKSGESFFKAECAACHSPGGDLAGIGTRLTNIEQLQNSWVTGRRAGAPASDPARRTIRVTVKFVDGSTVTGNAMRVDDFVVSLTTDAGEYRSYTRRASTPAIAAVEVKDPLAQHRVLWTKLRDKNMHDVTAYLASLK